MSIEFARPAALLLLLAVPIYIVWIRRQRRALPTPRSGALAGVAKPFWSHVAFLPPALRALAIGLLIVALAGPRTGASVVEVRTEGVPIAVAIDISSSMLAEDFGGQSRLQVARATTARFIAGREDDPIALVAFAGEAITQVPLTVDYPVLFGALDNLRVGLLEDGTAMGAGLATAVRRVRAVPARSGAVILMSDGASNRGAITPLEAAQAAAALGVRVFTIGIGSETDVRTNPDPLAAADPAAGLDERLLQRVADLTGGRYFRATDPRALDRVYARIDSLVPSPLDTRVFRSYTEWYLPLVLLAAGLLLAEWLLRGSRWGVVGG